MKIKTDPFEIFENKPFILNLNNIISYLQFTDNGQ